MQNHEPFLLDRDHERLAKGARPWLPLRGHGCILLFVGVFALAGLCFLAGMVSQWVQFVVLSTDYAETEGQVLGRRIESDEGTTYYVSYRYVVDDKVHTAEDSVSKKTYHALEEVGSLTVRYGSETQPYRPSNPVVSAGCWP